MNTSIGEATQLSEHGEALPQSGAEHEDNGGKACKSEIPLPTGMRCTLILDTKSASTRI